MSTSHSYNGVKWIYISTDSEYISNKMKKIHRVLSNVIMDEDVTRYLPRMDRLRFQGILCFAQHAKIYGLQNLKYGYLPINL